MGCYIGFDSIGLPCQAVPGLGLENFSTVFIISSGAFEVPFSPRRLVEKLLELVKCGPAHELDHLFFLGWE